MGTFVAARAHHDLKHMPSLQNLECKTFYVNLSSGPRALLLCFFEVFLAEKFGFLAHEPTYGVHFFHAHFIHGRLLLLQSRFHVVVREITPYFVGLNGDKKKKAKAQTKRKNKRAKDSFLKCIDMCHIVQIM